MNHHNHHHHHLSYYYQKTYLSIVASKTSPPSPSCHHSTLHNPHPQMYPIVVWEWMVTCQDRVPKSCCCCCLRLHDDVNNLPLVTSWQSQHPALPIPFLHRSELTFWPILPHVEKTTIILYSRRGRNWVDSRNSCYWRERSMCWVWMRWRWLVWRGWWTVVQDEGWRVLYCWLLGVVVVPSSFCRHLFRLQKTMTTRRRRRRRWWCDDCYCCCRHYCRCPRWKKQQSLRMFCWQWQPAPSPFPRIFELLFVLQCHRRRDWWDGKLLHLQWTNLEISHLLLVASMLLFVVFGMHCLAAKIRSWRHRWNKVQWKRRTMLLR